MGIFDDISADPAMRSGLLNAGLSLMANSRGRSLTQALGEAGMAGMQGYGQAKQTALDEAMKNAQMDSLKRKAAKDAQIQDMLAGAFGGSGQMSQGQMSQGQTPQGNYPLNLNQLSMLAASGAPGANDLFNMYKYANEGVKREAGNYYINPISGQREYMPVVPQGATMSATGEVVPLRGAAAANAGYKGSEAAAVEGAKAGLDLVAVPMPDGSTRMMRRDQAAAALSQTHMGQAPMGQAPMGQAPMGQAPSIGVSQSPAAKEYAVETAKASADVYKNLQSAGMTAPGKIAKYQQLGKLLEGVDGGALSASGLQVAQLANSLGIKIDKNLSNKEAAAALTNELALSLRDPSAGGGMPGSLSDTDRQFLMNSVPNLGQSAEGRRQMVQMQTAVLKRQADTAAFARKWQRAFGAIDAANPKTGLSFQDELQRWSSANPLFPGQ